MLRKDLGPMKVMGFARYNAKDDVQAPDLIAAARLWQKEFLSRQPGIAMHCFLGNAAGGYADAILARDEASFAAMSEAHMQAPSSRAFMEMLDPGSIRLCLNRLMEDLNALPDRFAAIEFGTFRPRKDVDFSEEALMAASGRVEREYLSAHPESQAHLMARAGEDTYSEICFVETVGAAREICSGYVSSNACMPLLGLFDPDSVDLDFWHVLA
ncbi:hypothetical protein [Roseibium sp.]|uniref:hypothetical protein n=1 Tax=Roseibium sp. TaxID=1936156 RepID=UPI003A96BE52